MEYMTPSEAAEIWGISPRRVQLLCRERRIDGVCRTGRAWLIPRESEKPEDARRGGVCRPNAQEDNEVCPFIAPLITAVIRTPPGGADGCAARLTGDEGRQYAAELAYARGDFAAAVKGSVHGGKYAVCGAMTRAISCISLGRYDEYEEARDELSRLCALYRKTYGKSSQPAASAELALASIAVSRYASDYCPAWLAAGEFDSLAPAARPMAMYFRAKRLHSLAKNETVLAISETTLKLTAGGDYAIYHIYLNIMCALSLAGAKDDERAARYLMQALELALPDGIISPFAEHLSSFGGIFERCAKKQYPEAYRNIYALWKESWQHWIEVHNLTEKHGKTTALTLREHQAASLARIGCSNAEIAQRMGIGVNSVKYYMKNVFEKLYIKSRSELAKYL